MWATGGLRAGLRGGREVQVCLVNTPGGGHAVIGFYLAKELVSLGHQVTVLTACASETDKKMSKPPFNRFDEVLPVRSEEKVANRTCGFRELTRTPISLDMTVARTHMYTYDVKVWDLSPFKDHFLSRHAKQPSVTIRNFCIAV
jgi:hypothetical protein